MNNNSSKITVLMAVYNGEKCLPLTMESVLSQSYRDFEFLIINDGSTDNTKEIIKSYDDVRIRLHNNESNIGQTKSLNVGLSLARGDYVARIDADDYSIPDRLEKQYKYISSHPEYAAISSYCAVVDESDRKRSISKGYSEYKDIIIKLLTGSPMNHVGVMMDKEVILSLGGYNPEYKISADFDLWSQLVRKGHKITTLHEVLSVFRSSEDSYSYRNKVTKLDENTDIIYENIKHFSSHSVDRKSVGLLVNMFYDDFKNMSDEDIFNAERIYSSIISNLRPEFSVEIKSSEIKKILSMNYWIAAYHYILDTNNKKAHNIIKLCIKNHGVSLPSIVIYLLTYLNVNTKKYINTIRNIYHGVYIKISRS